MTRFIIATAERRARRPFRLTDVSGRANFGTMVYNSSTGRHECRMDQDKFLEASQRIALAGRMAGCCVYVSGVEEGAEVAEPAKAEGQTSEEEVEQPLPDEAPAPADSEPEDAELSRDAEEISAKTKFFTLKKIAKARGINVEGLNGSAAYAEAILAADKA